MDESAANLGVWLASEIPVSESLSILVLGSKTWTEVLYLVSPLSRKVKNGITLGVEGVTDKASEPKIRFRDPNEGDWDLVILSPIYCESAGPKNIRLDLIRGLVSAKLAATSKIILCVPSTPETSPISLRLRVFGNTIPLPEDVKGITSEEDVFQILEGLGFAQCITYRMESRVDVSKFMKSLPGGLKELSDWLRVSVEACRKAGTNEKNLLRRLCERDVDEVSQPKTIFTITIPDGFERDSRAQPSFREWWPNGDFKTFRNFGLEKWNQTRETWATEGSAAIGGSSVTPKKPIVRVPKLTPMELNVLVENLTTNHERIELPGPMRLDDLLDVLVDVWDSLDDGA